MNVFIMLSNYGCTAFQLCHASTKDKFEKISLDQIARWIPEFVEFKRGRAALALDIYLADDKKVRYTCLGFEDGSVSLSVVRVGDEKAELVRQFHTSYAGTVSAILFLKSGQLLVGNVSTE